MSDHRERVAKSKKCVWVGKGSTSTGSAAISGLSALKEPCFKIKVEFSCQGPNLWCCGQPQETVPGPPSQQIHISARSGMSCPCQVTSEVRSQHTLSATMYLNTDMNDNSYLTPSPCLISLGVSIKFAASRPHILAALLQSKKAAVGLKMHIKSARGHIIILSCFYP